MELAAVATLLGLDPVLFLSRGGVDWLVQKAALEKAHKRKLEDDEHARKMQAVLIVNQLAKSIK